MPVGPQFVSFPPLVRQLSFGARLDVAGGGGGGGFFDPVPGIKVVRVGDPGFAAAQQRAIDLGTFTPTFTGEPIPPPLEKKPMSIIDDILGGIGSIFGSSGEPEPGVFGPPEPSFIDKILGGLSSVFGGDEPTVTAAGGGVGAVAGLAGGFAVDLITKELLERFGGGGSAGGVFQTSQATEPDQVSLAELIKQFFPGATGGPLGFPSGPQLTGGGEMPATQLPSIFMGSAPSAFHVTPAGRIVPNSLTLMADGQGGMAFFVHAGRPTHFSKIGKWPRAKRHHHHPR